MENEYQDIIKRAEAWLEQPIQEDAEVAINQASDLIEDLQRMMHYEGASKKVVGALIGRIKGTQKVLKSIEKVDWVNIGDGEMAIGHRPSIKLIQDLKLQNTTHILTLLSEKEEALKIQALSKKQNLGWLWFSMESAEPPKEDRTQELAAVFVEMGNILQNKGRIYVHCSAGIHRTGMISYAFLRFLGNNASEAESLLKKLRTTTSEGVGKERIDWVNSIYKALREFDKKR